MKYLSLLQVALLASAVSISLAAYSACPNESAAMVVCPEKTSYMTTVCGNYLQHECNSKVYESANSNLWGTTYDYCKKVTFGAGASKVCYRSANCYWDAMTNSCKTGTATDHSRNMVTDGWCNNPGCDGE